MGSMVAPPKSAEPTRDEENTFAIELPAVTSDPSDGSHVTVEAPAGELQHWAPCGNCSSRVAERWAVRVKVRNTGSSELRGLAVVCAASREPTRTLSGQWSEVIPSGATADLELAAEGPLQLSPQGELELSCRTLIYRAVGTRYREEEAPERIRVRQSLELRPKYRVP